MPPECMEIKKKGWLSGLSGLSDLLAGSLPRGCLNACAAAACMSQQMVFGWILDGKELQANLDWAGLEQGGRVILLWVF